MTNVNLNGTYASGYGSGSYGNGPYGGYPAYAGASAIAVAGIVSIPVNLSATEVAQGNGISVPGGLAYSSSLTGTSVFVAAEAVAGGISGNTASSSPVASAAGLANTGILSSSLGLTVPAASATAPSGTVAVQTGFNGGAGGVFASATTFAQYGIVTGTIHGSAASALGAASIGTASDGITSNPPAASATARAGSVVAQINVTLIATSSAAGAGGAISGTLSGRCTASPAQASSVVPAGSFTGTGKVTGTAASASASGYPGSITQSIHGSPCSASIVFPLNPGLGTGVHGPVLLPSISLPVPSISAIGSLSPCLIKARAIAGGTGNNQPGPAVTLNAAAISGKINCEVPLPAFIGMCQAPIGTVEGTGRNIWVGGWWPGGW